MTRSLGLLKVLCGDGPRATPRTRQGEAMVMVYALCGAAIPKGDENPRETKKSPRPGDRWASGRSEPVPESSGRCRGRCERRSANAVAGDFDTCQFHDRRRGGDGAMLLVHRRRIRQRGGRHDGEDGGEGGEAADHGVLRFVACCDGTNSRSRVTPPEAGCDELRESGDEMQKARTGLGGDGQDMARETSCHRANPASSAAEHRLIARCQRASSACRTWPTSVDSTSHHKADPTSTPDTMPPG